MPTMVLIKQAKLGLIPAVRSVAQPARCSGTGTGTGAGTGTGSGSGSCSGSVIYLDRLFFHTSVRLPCIACCDSLADKGPKQD